MALAPIRDRPYPRGRTRRLRVILQDEQFVRSHIWALEDEAVRDLADIMRQARGEMSLSLVNVAGRYGTGEAWHATDAAFRVRTDELLMQIDRELEFLEQSAATNIFGHATRAYQAGYYGRAWATDQAVRSGTRVSFARLSVEAIRAQILSPYRGLTFLDRFADARLDFVQRIRRSMVLSQIQGEGIDRAVRRLADALGLDISRHGNDRGLFSRLEMICRTEILKASNIAARAIYEQNQDVLSGYRVIVTHDERTCEICGPLDNKFYLIDSGAEIPPFHPRCRCTIVPAVKDDVLSMLLSGPRQNYQDWALENDIGYLDDGGVFALRGKSPPRSSSDAAKDAAPGIFQ